MSPRKNSFLTVTDQFCGAGGSSIGAAAAGLEIRMAMNHWKLAVETHNTNFPDADHDCADVSASDPRRYPSTNILITSPECTTHSPAGGNRHRKSPQSDLFVPTVLDPATQRSRATMWDVVRFTEYHKYDAVIVENVVEAVRTWVLFWTWWQAMENLGYRGKIVSLNSMFALEGLVTPPAPQSRDRIYIVWTKKGNKDPDLFVNPTAPCLKCGDVEARQTWKTGRTVGKFGQRSQYIYTCPKCRAVVQPYYYCALNALDFTIPAQRIGDRKTPLRPRTLERVLYGLNRYGRRPLQITANNISGIACRVRGVDDPLFGQTTSNTTALVSPWLVSAGSNELFTPFISTLRTNGKGASLDGVTPAVCAGGQHHALITPSAIVRLNGSQRPVHGLDAPHTTVTGGADQHLMVSRAPFLVQYYGNGGDSAADESIPAVTTKDRHAVITPTDDIRVEDCYFRMMAPHEIGAAMAFPDTYVVLGKKGEQIKQYGNAVTPPAMAILIRRVVQSITGERAA